METTGEKMFTVEERVEAAAGHEVVNEKLLVAGEVVGFHGYEVRMAETAEELHVLFEIPFSGHLNITEAFHGDDAAVVEDGLVGRSISTLSEHLRRSSQQVFQFELLRLVKEHHLSSLKHAGGNTGRCCRHTGAGIWARRVNNLLSFVQSGRIPPSELAPEVAEQESGNEDEHDEVADHDGDDSGAADAGAGGGGIGVVQVFEGWRCLRFGGWGGDDGRRGGAVRRMAGLADDVATAGEGSATEGEISGKGFSGKGGERRGDGTGEVVG